MRLRHKTDEWIEYRGPIDPASGLPLTSSVFAFVRLFDDRKDTHLRVPAIGGATTLSVAHAGQFEVGDRVVVDGFIEAGLVQSMDPQSGTVTVSVPMPAAADAGAIVAVAFGDEIGGAFPWTIPMTHFVPSTGAQAGSFDYGLRARVPAEQPGLAPGAIVRIEIEIDFSDTVRVAESLRAYVTGAG